jgi:multicomponent Na+:H+ antiporter subunit E
MDKSQPNKGQSGYRFFIFIILMGIWMILSGLIDVRKVNDLFHLLLGVISCGLVTWMSSDLFFPNREIPFGARIRQGLRLIRYSWWLTGQIIISNIHLLKLAFQGNRSLQPQIIRYESKLQSDFEKFLLASSITLTPGTVTMKIIGQTYYIHAISNLTAEGLRDGEMEKRIAIIFAP